MVPELVELRLLRGQFLARVSDYERAAWLAGEWAARASAADSFLARARTSAALHRFAAAQADLIRAAEQGGDPDAIDAARAAILQAIGQYEEALRIRRRLVRLRADVTAIGAEASAAGRAGPGGGGGAALPRRARGVPRRVAVPARLARVPGGAGCGCGWASSTGRASGLAAAHERVPAYVAATGHLGEVEAALGRTDRAVALLTSAAEGSRGS